MERGRAERRGRGRGDASAGRGRQPNGCFSALTVLLLILIRILLLLLFFFLSSRYVRNRHLPLPFSRDVRLRQRRSIRRVLFHSMQSRRYPLADLRNKTKIPKKIL